MRITGILQTIGDITTCEHNTDPRGPEYDFQHLKGIIITTDNDDTLRAASNLLCATVDIYPHPVDGLQPGECTPERYAHALARLAHAEDHLAREVRSSQALARSLKDAEALITAIKADLQARAASDAEEARRSELSADAKSAAWVKYLDLRRMIRLVTNEDAKTLLVNDALTLAREYDLDPTPLELEAAKAQVRDLEALLAEYRVNRELHHQLLAERDRTIAALAAKQAEQERLMTAYRVQYHEADRALNRTQADLAETKLRLAHHPALPAGATEELATALAGCCSWSLRVNDHRSCYESIREHLTNSAHCGGEEPDEELIAECEASGAIYELQVYERTPVSFILVKAASFAALLDEVRDHKWQHISPVMNRDPT